MTADIHPDTFRYIPNFRLHGHKTLRGKFVSKQNSRGFLASNRTTGWTGWTNHGTRPLVKNETKHIGLLKEEVTFYFDYRYLHLLLNDSFKKNTSSWKHIHFESPDFCKFLQTFSLSRHESGHKILHPNQYHVTDCGTSAIGAVFSPSFHMTWCRCNV